MRTKLLNMGFEVFPNWRQPHRSFTAYLYAVTGGADELMSLGMKIAAEEPHRFHEGRPPDRRTVQRDDESAAAGR